MKFFYSILYCLHNRWQVAVTSCKSNLTRFRVKNRYKRLVTSTQYNKSPYTARTVLSSSLRGSVVKQVQHVVRKEIHQMCSVRYGASLLRNLSTEALTRFRWKPFVMQTESMCTCFVWPDQSCCYQTEDETRFEFHWYCSLSHVEVLEQVLMSSSRNSISFVICWPLFQTSE